MSYKSPIQVVWPDVKFLQALSKLMKYFHTEPLLQFNDAEMSLLTMEVAHVAMVDMKLPAEYFKVYKLAEESVEVAFNTEDFYRSLLTAKSSKTAVGEARMSLGRDGASVELWLTRSGHPTKKRSIPRWKDGGMEVPRPKIFFRSKMRCMLSDFMEVLLDMKALGAEHLKVDANAERWGFSHQGDIDSSMEFHKDDNWVLDCKIDPKFETQEAHYTLGYLLKMLTPFRSFVDVVILEMSSDMPMKISPELPQGVIDFYLAPCIGV